MLADRKFARLPQFSPAPGTSESPKEIGGSIWAITPDSSTYCASNIAKSYYEILHEIVQLGYEKGDL